jgi:hypothetical protein
MFFEAAIESGCVNYEASLTDHRQREKFVSTSFTVEYTQFQNTVLETSVLCT